MRTKQQQDGLSIWQRYRAKRAAQGKCMRSGCPNKARKGRVYCKEHASRASRGIK